MTACLLVDANSSALSITSANPSSCAGYILMTGAEYQVNTSPFSDFDTDLFLELLAWMLVVFITGFSTGIIARKLGR